MTIQEFLARVEGVQPNGSGATARCPAHDDRRSSLSVSQCQDGRVLVKCHAGCTLDEVLGKLGLRPRDLFPPREGVAPGKPRIVAGYDYVDETGNALYQVGRCEPKDFRQRRPDGRRGWKWGMEGVRCVAFRLPRVLATAKAGGVVSVVEDEKDVAALVAVGLTVKTNAGGTGKWRPEFAEAFKGCNGVVVLPDNDESGRKHVQDVARSVDAVGVPVKVVGLPDLPA